jgi:hypothetical protein
MAETNRDWVTRKLFEEHSLQFRTVWDLYVKYNTVLLTVNVAALALAVQYVDKGNRIPIILAFVLQHVVSTFTAVMVARYSKTTSERAKEIADLLLQEGELLSEQFGEGSSEKCRKVTRRRPTLPHVRF